MNDLHSLHTAVNKLRDAYNERPTQFKPFGEPIRHLHDLFSGHPNELKQDELETTIEVIHEGLTEIYNSGVIKGERGTTFSGRSSFILPALKPLREMKRLLPNILRLSKQEFEHQKSGLQGIQDTITKQSETISKGAKSNQFTAENEPVRVFVVHGQDLETKDMVARLLRKLGLEPIILHELPNLSRTIIEKFESSCDVDFAVAVLTPDDLGRAKANADNLQPRARQNVILELGYFLGKLGRKKVCALIHDGMEIPSDYAGVLFISLDYPNWQNELAREMHAAGLPVESNAIR